MKSPWKFLSNLTLRQRRTEGVSSPGDEADAKAVEVEKEHFPASPKVPDAQDLAPGNDDTLVGPDAARSDIDPPSSGLPVEFVGDEERSNAQVPPPGARAQESFGEGGSGGQHARKSNARRMRHVKENRPDGVVGKTVVSGEGQRARSISPPRETPIDPLRELDDEIGQLRTRLAEKLRQQNAQLREMLKRFDAS